MRIKKKNRWGILCLILCFFLLSGFTYQENKQRIYDNAGLLTEEEKEELEQLYQKYSLEDETDYILLTTDSTDGMESREYAKDFYVKQGVGYNKEDGDGNLLLIDMENRRLEMIDKGNSDDEITDAEVDHIIEKVKPHLSNGDYEEAASVYAEETHYAFTEDYDGSEEGGVYVDFTAVDDSKGQSGFRYLIYGVLALILSGIVTFSVVQSNKSHMTADGSTYGKNVKVNPSTRQDRFIRTVTTATPKPKDTDHGGGSKDSSGFGGGGSSF